MTSTRRLNYVAGRPIANQVVTPLGTGGTLTFFNSASAPADIVLDVQGYFSMESEPVAGAYVPVPPTRVMDTRTGLGGSTPASRATVDLQVTGRGGVPANRVAAVMLNVTAAYPHGTGHLSSTRRAPLRRGPRR